MATRPRQLHIYGDESSHTGNHKFLVYGTVSCERHKVPMILAELEKARQGRELEWKWSAPHHRGLYPAFVRAIFKCRDEHGLRYRCIAGNTRHARHTEYNNSDPDLGLEKYIFFHLLDYGRRQKGDARFYVLLDKRTNKYTAETQKRALNARDKKIHNWGYDRYAEVLDVESTSSRFVQAADVISGAVAHVMNERYLAPDASPEKRALAELVAKLARIPSVGPAARLKVKRGELRSIGMETLANVTDTCGFASWHMHLRVEEEEKLKARSKEQFAPYARTDTYGHVAADGFKIVLECARCDHRHTDYLSIRPAFANAQLKDRPLPACGKCGKNGIVLLKRR
jgi:hypothetical protein